MQESGKKQQLDKKEPLLKSPITGYKKNIQEALGFDPKELINQPEISKIEKESCTEREEDLLKSWNGYVYKKETKDKKTQYILVKKLDGGRQIVVVSSLNKDRTQKAERVQSRFFGKTRKSFYNLQALIVQSPDRPDCIDVTSWIPEETGFMMEVRQGDNPKKTRKEERCKLELGNNKLNPKNIVIDSIDSFVDLRSVIHEVGHALTHSQKTEQEREKDNSARILAKVCKKELEMNDVEIINAAETEYEMTVEQAMLLVKIDEHQANTLVDEFIDQTRNILKTTEEDGKRGKRKREKDYQSYDRSEMAGDIVSIFFPQAAVSERAQLIQQQAQDQLYEHYQRIKALFEFRYQQAESPKQEMTINTPEGEVIIFDNGSFLVIFMPETNHKREVFHLGFTGSIFEKREKKQTTSKFRLEFRNFERAETSLENLDQALEVEKKLCNLFGIKL